MRNANKNITWTNLTGISKFKTAKLKFTIQYTITRCQSFIVKFIAPTAAPLIKASAFFKPEGRVFIEDLHAFCYKILSNYSNAKVLHLETTDRNKDPKQQVKMADTPF